MSSTCSHFVFFLFAPKELLAASVSENATPVTIHCRLSRLIPQIWKYKTPKELFFASHIDAVVVDGGPDFPVFQCYSMTTDSFVTYFPRNLKNPHLFYGYGMGPPRDPFRRCKTM